jgi:hypothetical protein
VLVVVSADVVAVVAPAAEYSTTVLAVRLVGRGVATAFSDAVVSFSSSAEYHSR